MPSRLLASQPPCARCRLVAASSPAACPWRVDRRPAGACLELPDGEPVAAWYLHDGWVVLSTTDPGGAELSCCVRGPGSLIGCEVAGAVPFRTEVWAITDLIACRLPTAELRRWLGAPRGPQGAMLACAIDELGRRGADREVLCGSATTRVARLLVRLSAAPHPPGAPMAVPARVMARVLGLRAETVSRAVAELRRRGALGRGRALVIANPDRLRRIAGESTAAEPHESGASGRS